MKIKVAAFIEGYIVANSHHGDAGNLFCIHNVKFSNGRHAIVRDISGRCFCPGDTIQRYYAEWFFNSVQLHLLPFDYVDESEARRQFKEYCR